MWGPPSARGFAIPATRIAPPGESAAPQAVSCRTRTGAPIASDAPAGPGAAAETSTPAAIPPSGRYQPRPRMRRPGSSSSAAAGPAGRSAARAKAATASAAAGSRVAATPPPPGIGARVAPDFARVATRRAGSQGSAVALTRRERPGGVASPFTVFSTASITLGPARATRVSPTPSRTAPGPRHAAGSTAPRTAAWTRGPRGGRSSEREKPRGAEPASGEGGSDSRWAWTAGPRGKIRSAAPPDSPALPARSRTARTASCQRGSSPGAVAGGEGARRGEPAFFAASSKVRATCSRRGSSRSRRSAGAASRARAASSLSRAAAVFPASRSFRPSSRSVFASARTCSARSSCSIARISRMPRTICSLSL